MDNSSLEIDRSRVAHNLTNLAQQALGIKSEEAISRLASLNNFKSVGKKGNNMPSEKKQSFIARALSELSGFQREAFGETEGFEEINKALCELMERHLKQSFRNGIEVGAKKAHQKAKGQGSESVAGEEKDSGNAVLERIRKAAGEGK